MKVDELIKEIEDTINSASTMPLTNKNKVIVDGNVIIELLNEIEAALPDEIKQARWIQSEKQRILTEAKKEYEIVVGNAKRRAEELVAKDAILSSARSRSEELMTVTNENIKRMKMGTYDYVDKVLYDFQESMAKMNAMYQEMFNTLEEKFENIEKVLIRNREEIKDMAYKTQMDKDEK